MIVFTIAFGEAYIQKFFERCLPSLLTPNNLPSIQSEPLELDIFTQQCDWPVLQTYLARAAIKNVFGNRVVISTQPADLEDNTLMTSEKRSSYLLFHAINKSIKNNQSFLHAVPDLVYSDGVVNSCWALHRLTGKVVSVFNGRVAPPGGGEPFTNAELLQATAAPFGVQDFFFANMNADWRDHLTADFDSVPGDNQGHLIYARDGRLQLFCSSPNPFIGKFTLEDLFFFVSGRGFRCWDHEWPSRLLKTERMVVQTNLDWGMTIEPEQRSKREVVVSSLKDAGLPAASQFRQYASVFAPDAVETYRKHKFATEFSSFCFTSTRPLPAAVTTLKETS